MYGLSFSSPYPPPRLECFREGLLGGKATGQTNATCVSLTFLLVDTCTSTRSYIEMMIPSRPFFSGNQERRYEDGSFT